MNIPDLFVLMTVHFLTPVHLSLRVNGISHCNFILRVRTHLLKGAVDAQTSVRNEKTVYNAFVPGHML